MRINLHTSSNFGLSDFSVALTNGRIIIADVCDNPSVWYLKDESVICETQITVGRMNQDVWFNIDEAFASFSVNLNYVDRFVSVERG